MMSMLTGVLAAVGIAYGAHYLLTERPDLVEQYVTFIDVPGSAGDESSSANVRR